MSNLPPTSEIEPLGYVVLTSSADGRWEPDWDGRVHTDRAQAEDELFKAMQALGERFARLARVHVIPQPEVVERMVLDTRSSNVKGICDVVHSSDVRNDRHRWLVGYNEHGSITFVTPNGFRYTAHDGDTVVLYSDGSVVVERG